MNILIDQARIAGFRGIANVEISLPRVTVLIGTNNSGKTSIIKALQLALGDYSRYLTEEDFHIDNDDHVAESIVIDIRIVAMDAHGKRAKIFEDEWLEELGDIIQSEPDGSQFVVIRTKCERDKVRGGFLTARFWLEAWPEFDGWIDVKIISKRQIRKRFDALPFISIDAQRDIHQELSEKTSYIGKVLASVEYDDDDVEELEKMLAEINEKAIVKSEPLSDLKTHLDALSHSFEGSGQTDITPFPKKIRDLSKRFTVHFGENESNSFSMEYHGMGTRSWASMLTVKAFTELSAKKHAEEVKPFFPIIAAEEPEAHLHPNAQRTLYQQLKDSKGQIIVSTHSPFLAAMGDLQDLRSMVKLSNNVSVKQLPNVFDAEDLLILQREVMRFRGEVLFARGIILFEGVTEEQIVPAMFEHYFGFTAFCAGVNCISVAGKNYAPFIKLACSLGIPVCVVGDNDGNAKTTVEAQIFNIRRDTGLLLNADEFQIFFLSDNNDIEAELINELELKQELTEALVLSETKGSGNPQYVEAKQREISALSNEALLEKLRSAKASYAGFLAAVIYRNPQTRATEALVPLAFRNAFEQMRRWISA
jgi:putative ATP-dependent endonuclease of OLD family